MKLHVVHSAEPASERLEQLGDDELMLLVKRAETGPRYREAFDVLVRRHQRLVLTYADRYLGERDRALDVAQESFVTLWEGRHDYRPEGRFRSYLLAIAHNRCRERSRHERGQQRRADALRVRGGGAGSEPATGGEDADDAPLSALLERERAAEVRRRLAELDDKTRQVLVLRFANELSYEEIAEVTRGRVGTLKSRVSRGLAKLRDRLAEEYRA